MAPKYACGLFPLPRKQSGRRERERERGREGGRERVVTNALCPIVVEKEREGRKLTSPRDKFIIRGGERRGEKVLLSPSAAAAVS